MKQLIKALYRSLPFKHALFNVVKPIVPAALYKHLRFEGVIEVKIDPNHTFLLEHNYYNWIENEIYWRGLWGGWERESLKWWIALCKDKAVIMDIGANTGIYSLIAKTMNPQATVYAFEPIDDTFVSLNNNCKLNHAAIRCHKIALSDYNGTASMFIEVGRRNYVTSVNQNRSPGDYPVQEIKIPTQRLDTFIHNEAISTIGAMKIDVESHEPQVLAGMGAYLAEYKPDMLIEVLNNDVGAAIQALTQELGYCYYLLDETGTRSPIAQTTLITDAQAHNRNYIICKPETAKRIGLVPLS